MTNQQTPQPDEVLRLLREQNKLQQQLIEAQQQIIALQKRLDDMTPKNVPDEEVHWHIKSGGIGSNEAAKSSDLSLVREFRDWNVDFAKKYIKPYVNPKIYAECLHQMTRDLAEHIAELETEQQEKRQPPKPMITKPKVTKADNTSEAKPPKLIQLALMQ